MKKENLIALLEKIPPGTEIVLPVQNDGTGRIWPAVYGVRLMTARRAPGGNYFRYEKLEERNTERVAVLM